MGKKSLQQYIRFDKKLLQLLLDIKTHFEQKSKAYFSSNASDWQQSEKANFLAGLAFMIANYLAFDEKYIGERASLFLNKEIMQEIKKSLLKQKSTSFFHQPFDSKSYQNSWRIKKAFFYLGHLIKTWIFASKTKKLFNRTVKIVKKIADNIELNIKEEKGDNDTAIEVGNITVLDDDNKRQQIDNNNLTKDAQIKSPDFWHAKIIFWQAVVDRDKGQLVSNTNSESSNVVAGFENS